MRICFKGFLCGPDIPRKEVIHGAWEKPDGGPACKPPGKDESLGAFMVSSALLEGSTTTPHLPPSPDDPETQMISSALLEGSTPTPACWRWMGSEWGAVQWMRSGKSEWMQQFFNASGRCIICSAYLYSGADTAWYAVQLILHNMQCIFIVWSWYWRATKFFIWCLILLLSLNLAKYDISLDAKLDHMNSSWHFIYFCCGKV